MLAGPALCVAIKGISSLPAEKLGQLLSSSGRGGPGSLAPGQPVSNHASGIAALHQGLGSAWAVTDVLQVRMWCRRCTSPFQPLQLCLHQPAGVGPFVVPATDSLMLPPDMDS